MTIDEMIYMQREYKKQMADAEKFIDAVELLFENCALSKQARTDLEEIRAEAQEDYDKALEGWYAAHDAFYGQA